METKFKQTFRPMILAVLSLLMATACSNDDIELTTRQPAGANGIPFTATISMSGSQTRALSDPDGENKIQATWADGEHVALVYKVGSTTVVTDATVTAVDNGSGQMKGTISATLDAGVTTGTPVTLIYPYSAVNTTAGDDYGKVRNDLFTAQNGLLTGDGSISATCDLRQGTGTITLATTPASLSHDVTMASQIAIWKLSLMNYEDGATNAYALTTKSLTIKDGSDNVLAATSTLGTGKSEFYMALPVSGTGIKIEAVSGSDTYVLSKSGVTLTASTFYQSTAKLARLLNSAKLPSGSGTSASPGDVGKVVSADGRLFTTTAAATDAGTSGVAMIAYLGNASDCANGLAIALEDVSSNTLSYNNNGSYNEGKTAAEWCSEWNTSKAVTGGTWRLPSTKDWQHMFLGCGASGSYSDSPYDLGQGMSYKELKTKLNDAGGTALKTDSYWTSTEYVSGNSPWYVFFTTRHATFYLGKVRHSYYVRACLAF